MGPIPTRAGSSLWAENEVRHELHPPTRDRDIVGRHDRSRFLGYEMGGTSLSGWIIARLRNARRQAHVLPERLGFSRLGSIHDCTSEESAIAAHPNTSTDSIKHGNSRCHRDTHTDRHVYLHAYTNPIKYSHTEHYIDQQSNQRGDRYINLHSNEHFYCESNRYANLHADLHEHIHPHRYTHGHSDPG